MQLNIGGKKYEKARNIHTVGNDYGAGLASARHDSGWTVLAVPVRRYQGVGRAGYADFLPFIE